MLHTLSEEKPANDFAGCLPLKLKYFALLFTCIGPFLHEKKKKDMVSIL